MVMSIKSAKIKGCDTYYKNSNINEGYLIVHTNIMIVSAMAEF